MIRGAAFFDVDGTLTPTSSGQHLAELVGNAKEIAQIQAGYAAGTLSSDEACVLEARGWASRTPAEAQAFLESLPLVDGIAETVSWCRAHSLVPVLTTLAWDFVGAYLCSRFGFDRACGPRLHIVDGRYSGEVAEQFDEQAKRDFAIRMASELGVELRHCAAIGDGRSDVPLFGVVGCAIAFNATPEARAAANETVNGPDLHAVAPALSAWLDTIALPAS
ncbi:HAD family phosphatase [Micromonospora sp. H61]|uniref:HAD family hydrolase n=1 Tax=Micromonospora sp. H61 TaxID=2824888 RepID=UPI001B36C50D|nr:HAD family phosphatase [Micromonospora sp. H61]MBQ0989507.1 HAD family phosphatase [Micromonospora sp. H61]